MTATCSEIIVCDTPRNVTLGPNLGQRVLMCGAKIADRVIGHVNHEESNKGTEFARRLITWQMNRAFRGICAMVLDQKGYSLTADLRGLFTNPNANLTLTNGAFAVAGDGIVTSPVGADDFVGVSVKAGRYGNIYALAIGEVSIGSAQIRSKRQAGIDTIGIESVLTDAKVLEYRYLCLARNLLVATAAALNKTVYY